MCVGSSHQRMSGKEKAMENNVQKMREAFGGIQNLADALDLDEPNVVAIIDKCREALALPLRNCEVVTAEKQGRRCRETFSAWRDKFPNDMLIDAILKWAQMPYTEGGTNEQG